MTDCEKYFAISFQAKDWFINGVKLGLDPKMDDSEVFDSLEYLLTQTVIDRMDTKPVKEGENWFIENKLTIKGHVLYSHN